MSCSVCRHGAELADDELGRCSACVARGAIPPSIPDAAIEETADQEDETE